MTYGGGVSSVDQARRIFDLGVEKICLQTAAFSNPELIGNLAGIFGSQSIVVSIDVRKNWLGKYKLYESHRAGNSRVEWQRFLEIAVASGAGEILVNAVDRDGTMAGPDLELIRLASEGMGVPLIAAGGVSSMEDIRDMIASGANAVAAGAFFLFYGPHRAVLITYPSYNELEVLLDELQ
jgi:cyclase